MGILCMKESVTFVSFYLYEVRIQKVDKSFMAQAVTLHKIISTYLRIALENYNYNDLQFNRLDFQLQFLSSPMRLDRLPIHAMSCF